MNVLSLNTVSVIAFDLDDTLWPCMPTIYRAEKAIYDWLGENYPRITEAHNELDIQNIRKAFMNSKEQYHIDLSLMRRDMFKKLALDFGYDIEPMVEEGFQLFYRLRHEVDFYDDVFPVLQALKGQYRMGSISNGNADAGLTPLNDYFEFAINAADVMKRKPDRKIFDTFCEAMQVDAGHCLYVGDDPEYDIVGAREAGMPSIWLNRESKPWPQHLPPAQAEIDNLHQLLELLA